MRELLLVLASLFAALTLTGLARRYALTRKLLDIPGARSSHLVPTPRGGGIAIALVAIAVAGFLAAFGDVAPSGFATVAAGGLLVVAVGYIDDHRDLSARWRLLAHFTAASLCIVWLGEWSWLPPGVAWIAAVVAVVLVVWFINLYNFMDGIDGLAGVEAMTIAGSAAVLLWWHGHGGVALLAACYAAASAGFLCWNWQPAKIFMGDVGSGFLGFSLATLLVWALPLGEVFWALLILSGVFVVDSSVTLGRRFLAGEPITQAHRSHAYQHAARRIGSHRAISGAVLLINLLWLLPLAWLTAAASIPPLWAVAIAWAPLAVAAWWLGAGRA